MTHNKLPYRNDFLLLFSTVPLYVGAVSKYGQVVAVSLLVSVSLGFSVEMMFAAIVKEKRTFPGILYWFLIPLVLPPTFPFWMTGVTVVFSTIVCIVFFGGYGRHIVSPVAVGWTFAYLSYAGRFSLSWSFPFSGWSSGFLHWRAALPTVDHPFSLLELNDRLPLFDLLKGDFPLPPGNAIPAILILTGIFIVIFKAIELKTFFSMALTVVILTVLSDYLSPGRMIGIQSLLIGDFLFAGIYIAGDARTAARTAPGRIFTGVLAGVFSFTIRNFSSTPDGSYFALLLATVFSPLIDETVLSVHFRTQKP